MADSVTSLKQIFATYAWKENREEAKAYKYCPYCGTLLVLQEEGNKQRPTCRDCGFVHYKNPAAAVVILILDGDQVLLGKRKGAIGKGKWGTPSGYIEYDEDFLSTAVREVKEETGLEIEIGSIINVESAFISPEVHVLSVYLLARVIGGELVAGDDLEAVGWFPLAGPLPEMAFQADVDLIRYFERAGLAGLPVQTGPLTSPLLPSQS
jgi:ADP-ribose pyrophosphatase YjhB (NUDIX family)